MDAWLCKDIMLGVRSLYWADLNLLTAQNITVYNVAFQACNVSEDCQSNWIPNGHVEILLYVKAVFCLFVITEVNL